MIMYYSLSSNVMYLASFPGLPQLHFFVVFAYCKWSKTGRWERPGNEAMTYCLENKMLWKVSPQLVVKEHQIAESVWNSWESQWEVLLTRVTVQCPFMLLTTPYAAVLGRNQTLFRCILALPCSMYRSTELQSRATVAVLWKDRGGIRGTHMHCIVVSGIHASMQHVWTS